MGRVEVRQVSDASSFIADGDFPVSIKSGAVRAVKYDHEKPRYELLPARALEEVVMVYTMGAVKYSAHNWRLGLDWGRVFAAMMRHCWAYWRGEDHDKESGLHHMAHAAWGALTLVEYALMNVGKDDRPN